MKRLEFLEKAREIHGYRYKYLDLPEKLTLNDRVNVEYQNVVYFDIECEIGGALTPEYIKSAPMKISRKDIFLALAAKVPGEKEGELIDNPYSTWKQVNASLPDVAIEVLGPPPTSGTRDAFAELGLEGGCKKFAWIKALKKTNKSQYKSVCHTVREDGRYIEVGENDNLIVQKLQANPSVLGVFGFSFLDQNADKVQGALIESVEPTFESISDKSYPISRPLFFYVKKAHIEVVPGILGYLTEFTSERAWGEDGYLAEKGMIPLPIKERRAMAENTRGLVPMTGKEGLK